MARPRTNLYQKILEILAQSEPLPPEARAPFSHYQRTSRSFCNLLDYFDSHLDELDVSPAVRRRYMGQLQGMSTPGSRYPSRRTNPLHRP